MPARPDEERRLVAYNRYGINREGIATDLKEAMLAILANYTGPGVAGVGLPNDKVFWADQGGSNPTPPRPFVAFTISSPSGAMGNSDIRRFGVPEVWRITVTDDADDTYTVTIAGTDYNFAASGDDIEAIRDGLLAAIGTPTEANAVALDDDRIQIEGTLASQRLFVTTSPASMTADRVRKTVISRTYKTVKVPIRISCFGKFDDDDPDAEQGGPGIAEQCAWGLQHLDIMAKMRENKHIILRVLQFPDASGVFEKEYRSLGRLDLELATTGHMDATMDNATSVTVKGSLTGGQTSVVTAPTTGTPWS
jgi:hypothetical protein